MKNFTPKDFHLGSEELNAQIRDTLDIEQIVFRQMLSTNISASQDETIFAANVRVLMNYLPTSKKQEIYERTEEYMSKIQRWDYKYWCGVPLGTIEHKVNGSPFLVEDEVTDWHKLYEIILEILEECGLTWKFDEWQKEVQKVKEKKPEPTPLLENIYNAPVEAAKQEKQGSVQHCKVCQDVINKETNPGMHYKGADGVGKLICKKCESLAKVRFGEKT